MSQISVTEAYKKYDSFIVGLIIKFGGRNELKDLRDGVWYRIVTQNYLEKYDPTKINSIYDYLYQVVRSVCVNRSRQKKIKPLDLAVHPDQMKTDEGDESDFFLDVLFGKCASCEQDVEYQMLVERIENSLAKIPSWGSATVIEEVEGVSTPVVYEKSYVQIFRMRFMGFSQDEIAEKLNVTPGSVSGYMKKMKEIISSMLNSLGYNIFTDVKGQPAMV